MKMKFLNLKFSTPLRSISSVFAIVLAFVFVTEPVSARTLNLGWTSVRALGMGNAYTAVVDNSDALFYNPASLAKVRGLNWTIFELHPGVNGVESVQEIMAIQGGGGEVKDIINGLYGKRLWLGSGAKTALTAPSLGFAGFGNTEAGISVQNRPNPTMNLNWYFDYGFVMGSALNLVPGIIQLGASVKRVNRTGTTLPLGPATLATLDPDALQAELKRRGTGYGMDVAMNINVPGPVSPSLAVVYRDLGFTSFSHEEGAGAPPSIAPELIIGGSLTVDAALVSVTSALDYRYALDTRTQAAKKIGLGFELSLPLIDIRAGFHQGYYTAGLGLDLFLLQLDAATYGVELGEFPGQLEDRRYMLQLTFELGIDPGDFGVGGLFGGESKPGERRRLKRRR